MPASIVRSARRLSSGSGTTRLPCCPFLRNWNSLTCGRDYGREPSNSTSAAGTGAHSFLRTGISATALCSRPRAPSGSSPKSPRKPALSPVGEHRRAMAPHILNQPLDLVAALQQSLEQALQFAFITAQPGARDLLPGFIDHLHGKM